MGHVVLLSRRLLLLALTTLALSLVACGGGDDGGGGGAGAGAGALSLEQRNLATGRLANRFEQLTGGATATPEQWEALRAWVLTQPEFVDAGVGDQTLWARFADGRYFLYSDNWRPLPGAQAAALRQAALRPASPLLKDAIDIPASPDALLLGFTGDEFTDGVPAMRRMAKALDTRGWIPGGPRPLTLAALQSATQLGFLFLTSHSGMFGPTGDKHFAMMVDDEVTLINEVSHSEELDGGSLIYHRDRTDWQRFGLGKNPRYAITSRFVDANLRLAPASLVILLSCESGSFEASEFRDSLMARGAGTVIGWEGKSNAHAFHAMDLMVDRLTGMNAVDAVTPANRAFKMEDVWAYLDRKGELVTPPGESGAGPTPVRRFGSGFTMLNPILAELQATGADKLVLHGNFGNEPVTVSVGGKEFGATLSADGTMVDVDLGPEAHGEVVVTTRKRKSNPRVLASWRGQVQYVQKKEDAGCDPVFSNTVTVDLHLRADGHGVRDEVDGPVRDNRNPNMPASDTTATWRADGTCVMDGQTQATWSGSGSVPLLLYDFRSIPVSLPTADVLIARVDAVQKRIQLALTTGPTARTTVTTPDDTSKQPLLFQVDAMGFLNDGSDLFRDLMPWGTFLPFGSGLDVPAAQQAKGSPDGVPGETLTIHWGLTASPAYDDTIGR